MTSAAAFARAFEKEAIATLAATLRNPDAPAAVRARSAEQLLNVGRYPTGPITGEQIATMTDAEREQLVDKLLEFYIERDPEILENYMRSHPEIRLPPTPRRRLCRPTRRATTEAEARASYSPHPDRAVAENPFHTASGRARAPAPDR